MFQTQSQLNNYQLKQDNLMINTQMNMQSSFYNQYHNPIKENIYEQNNSNSNNQSIDYGEPKKDERDLDIMYVNKIFYNKQFKLIFFLF